MRRPAPQRQRSAKLKAFPAPRNGWISNLSLAAPNAKNPDGTNVSGAAVLDNFFPTATGIRLVRGSERYATLNDETRPVLSMFQYVVGSVARLFAANENTIFDITSVPSPYNTTIGDGEGNEIGDDLGNVLGMVSTENLDVMTGFTGGDWSVQQFATAGGVFLVGVNGEDLGFIYDGSNFYPAIAGGVQALAYDTLVESFTEGAVVTGGTSGATGTILRVLDNGDGTGTLWLVSMGEDSFEADEALTDDEGGEAEVTSPETVLSPSITFPDGSGLTTADLIFAWAYKNRLFFIQKDSLDIWYLPVDQVGGELAKFPLGGIFGQGGSLLFGATWSTDAGAQGGLSEQVIFVTTEGEVAVYQGANPSEAEDWGKVGVYRIGRPLGPKAWIRDGGDLVIATSIGYVRLTEAIRREMAALGPTAVSYPIEVAWNEAVERRSGAQWHCEVWPSKQMAVVALPTINEQQPAMFLANIRTGAWCRRPNWDATCVIVYQERLLFGTSGGGIVEANVSGLDEDRPYTGVCVPLFEDLGSPASLKVVTLARPVALAPIETRLDVSVQSDYRIALPPVPNAEPVPIGGQWGNAVWGQSAWGATLETVPNQMWRSSPGRGYAVSPAVQVTSGAIVPLDLELVRVELTFETAEIVT